MNQEIKPLERLFLWRLAVTDGGWLDRVKPEMKPTSRRRALVTAGLIEETRRRREETGSQATFITLTDKGWGLLAESLDGDLNTRTPAGTEVLHLLLLKLKTFLDRRDLSLGDLFAPGDAKPATESAPAVPLATVDDDGDGDGDAARRIASAYMGLSGGQTNVRVRLRDLRRATPSIPRAEFDSALFDLEARGEASLYRLDNPHEIGPEDRDAVLRTPLGEDRHIIYLGGRRS